MYLLTKHHSLERHLIMAGESIRHTANTPSSSSFHKLMPYSLLFTWWQKSLDVQLTQVVSVLCRLAKATRSCLDPSVCPLWPVRETLFANRLTLLEKILYRHLGDLAFQETERGKIFHVGYHSSSGHEEINTQGEVSLRCMCH